MKKAFTILTLPVCKNPYPNQLMTNKKDYLKE